MYLFFKCTLWAIQAAFMLKCLFHNYATYWSFETNHLCMHVDLTLVNHINWAKSLSLRLHHSHQKAYLSSCGNSYFPRLKSKAGSLLLCLTATICKSVMSCHISRYDIKFNWYWSQNDIHTVTNLQTSWYPEFPYLMQKWKFPSGIPSFSMLLPDLWSDEW